MQPKISMYLTVAAKGQGHCGSEPYNPVASNNACSSPGENFGRDYGSLCYAVIMGSSQADGGIWEDKTTRICHTMLTIK